jgi:hypothetical protein
MVEMTPQERQYRRHLYGIIQSSVQAAGGPTAVGKRCGMLPHTVTALGVAHLPSLRVLLRVAVACNTTPAAWLAEAERRIAEVSYRPEPGDELSGFSGAFGMDDAGL